MPLLKRVQNQHNGQAICDQLHTLSKVAMRMTQRGIAIDMNARKAHHDAQQTIIDKAIADFKALYGDTFQLGASGQHPSLKVLFFNVLGAPVMAYSEKTGKPSLNNTTLQRLISLKHPSMETAKIVYNMRKASKLQSTYIDGLPLVGECIYPSWKEWGTRTGRWASSHPNFQNWPANMRNLAIPREGKILCKADYSQLELRIVALLAQDEVLLRAYEEGKDVHKMTAAAIFGVPEKEVTKAQRNMAKTVEYAFNYQFSDDVSTVWRTQVVKNPALTVPMLEVFRREWFKLHPAIRDWQLRSVRDARFNGYVEAPLMQRRIVFHDGQVDPNIVLNHPVQATAGDIANQAILGVDADIDWSKESILAQVHDEILLEGPDEQRLSDILKRHMIQTIELNGCSMTFTIELKVGKDWYNMTVKE